MRLRDRDSSLNCCVIVFILVMTARLNPFDSPAEGGLAQG